MKAKFPSTCTACGESIRPGKEITKEQSGKWVHSHCSAESIEIP